MSKRLISNDVIAKALRMAGGDVAKAAKMVGYHRESIYRRIHRSPKLQQVMQHEREKMVNFAEVGLRKLLRQTEPDLGAITFTLKTLGKRYGYVDRTEVDFNVGLRIAGRSSDDVLQELMDEIMKTIQDE